MGIRLYMLILDIGDFYVKWHGLTLSNKFKQHKYEKETEPEIV